MTSNAHNHAHEHIHPHAESENDLQRVQRLAMFLESHFGEVHMNVPEPEKGGEDGQDEEVPEPVLLIRLDEADALVHLKSMVSRRLSPSFHFSFFFDVSLPFLGSGTEGGSGKIRLWRHFCIEFRQLMGVVSLIAGISFFPDYI